MYKTLIVNQKDAILQITINRPEALNALNAQVFSDLDHIFSNIGADIRGVLLTGMGSKSFVAGADIKEFTGLSAEQATQLSRRGQIVFEKIESLHIPVVAAINGFALGGGCELAMACHIRLASKNARFGQPEVNLGLIPGYGGNIRLPRIVGPSHAYKLLLSGAMIGAEEALQIGLVSDTFSSEDLIEESIKLLTKITEKSPFAIKNILAVLKQTTFREDDYILESEIFGKCMIHADANEGIAAFLEKRKPNF